MYTSNKILIFGIMTIILLVLGNLLFPFYSSNANQNVLLPREGTETIPLHLLITENNYAESGSFNSSWTFIFSLNQSLNKIQLIDQIDFSYGVGGENVSYSSSIYFEYFGRSQVTNNTWMLIDTGYMGVDGGGFGFAAAGTRSISDYFPYTYRDFFSRGMNEFRINFSLSYVIYTIENPKFLFRVAMSILSVRLLIIEHFQAYNLWLIFGSSFVALLLTLGASLKSKEIRLLIERIKNKTSTARELIK